MGDYHGDDTNHLRSGPPDGEEWSIIQTSTATYHVREDPATVERALRVADATGDAATFHTALVGRQIRLDPASGPLRVRPFSEPDAAVGRGKVAGKIAGWALVLTSLALIALGATLISFSVGALFFDGPTTPHELIDWAQKQEAPEATDISPLAAGL